MKLPDDQMQKLEVIAAANTNSVSNLIRLAVAKLIDDASRNGGRLPINPTVSLASLSEIPAVEADEVYPTAVNFSVAPEVEPKAGDTDGKEGE